MHESEEWVLLYVSQELSSQNVVRLEEFNKVSFEIGDNIDGEV